VECWRWILATKGNQELKHKTIKMWHICKNSRGKKKKKTLNSKQQKLGEMELWK
jgi:hypothetical protein